MDWIRSHLERLLSDSEHRRAEPEHGFTLTGDEENKIPGEMDVEGEGTPWIHIPMLGKDQKNWTTQAV